MTDWNSNFIGIRFPKTIVVLLIYLAPCLSYSADVQITCKPGMRIYIDDKFVGISTTEQDGKYVTGLSEGIHVFRIEKTGIAPKEIEWEVRKEPTEIIVVLDDFEKLETRNPNYPEFRKKLPKDCILDPKTGLVWGGGLAGTTHSWEEAYKFSKTMYAGGSFRGLWNGGLWRLPTISELKELRIINEEIKEQPKKKGFKALFKGEWGKTDPTQILRIDLGPWYDRYVWTSSEGVWFDFETGKTGTECKQFSRIGMVTVLDGSDQGRYEWKN